MTIDVIIATYNRAHLLERALFSILENRMDGRFDFEIIVVDNNSSDNTFHVVSQLAAESEGKIRYLRETRQGKSFAVNTGVAAGGGDVVALTDDDQRVGDQWLSAICEAIEGGYDYVTGPVHGDWEVAQPAWYDDRLRGALSLFEGGNERSRHDGDESRDGFSGGNGAVRRSVIEKIGGFHTALGKFAGRLGMCEDGEFFIRLKRAGFEGGYDPRMKVFHRVPAERLTRSYFRSWHRRYGQSMAIIDTLHPKPAPYWFGAPRFLIRRTAETLPLMIGAGLRGDTAGVFEQELNLWFMLGFIEGKFLKRDDEAS
jgi:glycosyltransferase involved in cell wall biosynthesis